MTTRNALRIGGVAFLTIVAAALLPSATSARSAQPTRRCGVVSGARWTYHGRSGNHYALLAGGTASCAAARASVPRLTHTRHRSFTALAGAPAGFICVATPVPDLRLRTAIPKPPAAGLAVAGACNAKNHSGFFDWAAVS